MRSGKYARPWQHNREIYLGVSAKQDHCELLNNS